MKFVKSIFITTVALGCGLCSCDNKENKKITNKQSVGNKERDLLDQDKSREKDISYKEIVLHRIRDLEERLNNIEETKLKALKIDKNTAEKTLKEAKNRINDINSRLLEANNKEYDAELILRKSGKEYASAKNDFLKNPNNEELAKKHTELKNKHQNDVNNKRVYSILIDKIKEEALGAEKELSLLYTNFEKAKKAFVDAETKAGVQEIKATLEKEKKTLSEIENLEKGVFSSNKRKL